MIGRGSRILKNKSEFNVIDLGNNVVRFGHWSAPVDWKQLFRSPDFYFENLLSDEEIEREFKYVMPPEMREQFQQSEIVDFDVEAAYDVVIEKVLDLKLF